MFLVHQILEIWAGHMRRWQKITTFLYIFSSSRCNVSSYIWLVCSLILNLQAKYYSIVLFPRHNIIWNNLRKTLLCLISYLQMTNLVFLDLYVVINIVRNRQYYSIENETYFYVIMFVTSIEKVNKIIIICLISVVIFP